MELNIDKSIEDRIKILREHFKEKNLDMNINYAIIGAGHLEKNIQEIYSKNIQLAIVISNQKDIELQSGNIEEIVRKYSKEDFHKIMLVKLENTMIELKKYIISDAYIKSEVYFKENSKTYNPIPKNDSIKSQIYYKNKKHHSHKRR